jgi:hypothetical protein
MYGGTCIDRPTTVEVAAGDDHLTISAGTIVLNRGSVGHPPFAGPARRPGWGGAGGHRAVMHFHVGDVVVAHPRIVYEGVSHVEPYATTHETRIALGGLTLGRRFIGPRL